MTALLKVLTIVGARPQFIKAAPVSLALKSAGIKEVLVDTGQHYDTKMCDVFFEQLSLNVPQHRLEIGSGTHGYQTGEGLMRLEPILELEKPDLVLVYGDTNATLAGALTSAKMHFPLAHVEAGLRSFDRHMPEEVNRIITDHLSHWLFAPTHTAVEHLKQEGIRKGVHLVGDVMMDALLLYQPIAQKQYPNLLVDLGLEQYKYYVLTMHRAETSAEQESVKAILQSLDGMGIPVVFPVHPRIRSLVEGLRPFKNIIVLDPLSYFEMLLLTERALAVVTDSGGIQKEAAFLETPCVTLRNTTEWPETLESGWNCLVGRSVPNMRDALLNVTPGKSSVRKLYGDGKASQEIVTILTSGQEAFS